MLSIWRSLTLAATLGAAFFSMAPSPASAETYEQYLARLRDVCAVECLEPRDLLNRARDRRESDDGDLAGILDISHVSRAGDMYRLHTEEPRQNFEDLRQLDFGMRETRSRPVTSSSDIIVEMDEQTFLDLFSVPVSAEERARLEEKGEIVVEGDREGEARRKPTLQELRNLVEGRRVVVRGQPRMAVLFKGARRDFRRKQLTLELRNADDMVMLPRYDEDGNPILDGPLANLR